MYPCGASDLSKRDLSAAEEADEGSDSRRNLPDTSGLSSVGKAVSAAGGGVFGRQPQTVV